MVLKHDDVILIWCTLPINTDRYFYDFFHTKVLCIENIVRSMILWFRDQSNKKMTHNNNILI